MIDYDSCCCGCIDCAECWPELQEKVSCSACDCEFHRYEMEVDEKYVRICKDCHDAGYRECSCCGNAAKLIDGAICGECWAEELQEALA